MSFLDSPMCRCELMRAMVLTDQTQGQCAEEHTCPPGQLCPLRDCFSDEEIAASEVRVPVLNIKKKTGKL